MKVKLDWDNIAKDVADKLKKGYWPWAIKNGVENITRSDLGSVLVNGGYTTDSGIRKNIGDIMDKVLALVKESVNEGEGEGYLTPKAFDKNKKSTGAPNIYYYKLGYKPVPKKIKGSGLEVKQLF